MMFRFIIVILLCFCLFDLNYGCDNRKNIVAKNVGSDITDNITFRIYRPKTVREFKNYTFECGLSVIDDLNPELKTIIFLHGFSERPSLLLDTESVYHILDALAKYENVNFILVDYEKLVKARIGNYLSILPITFQFFDAYKNAKLIGHAMGYFFKSFLEECNCEDNLHVIGFSIGAQLLHFSAQILGNRKLQRVTALEAGGPVYGYPLIRAPHITRRDAQFMDGIHTDGGPLGLGYPNSFAHADFYVNNGKAPQPHCKNNTFFKTDFETLVKCNHYASVLYYAESIKNPKAFPSRKCRSLNKYCTNEFNYMGYGVTLSATGNYYLRTNEFPPYGKGNT